MALERKTVIDRIIIDREGLVKVSLSFEFTDDNLTDVAAAHQVILEPGSNLNAIFQSVNAQIAQRRWPGISTAQGLRVKAVTDIFWTQAVIDAWRARQAASILVP